MKKQTIKDIAAVLTTKMRTVNTFIEGYEGEGMSLKRECPIYNELRGMLRMLDIMGVSYEIVYKKAECDTFNGIIIDGEFYDAYGIYKR